ncbi:hypothetical protein C2845_PM16G21580 [Panicum miliaceum]|uniref:Uncharacterized protein n=1 Tax=Panicum miliaceum TaxID=4540 RepID=A0A3L6PZS0_PANMI|nr:hypothetical protein C2845_PM16G21580 [Panicum miliaceum]
MFRAIYPEHYSELEKDMPFQEDIEKIDEYDKAMTNCNTSIFHIDATTFSLYFCMIATKGVKLASRVMETAALRLDKHDEISSCTTKQTLAMYVSSFVKLVKDAYDKKFNDESIFSLLGAFRGVAAVGRILLQDAVANVNYVGYSSLSLVLDADDTSWREFEQKMNNLEEKFRAVSKSTKAYEILRPTMTDAMKHTMFYISAVVGRHEMVLGYVPGTKGRSRASDDGEPGALGRSGSITTLVDIDDDHKTHVASHLTRFHQRASLKTLIIYHSPQVEVNHTNTELGSFPVQKGCVFNHAKHFSTPILKNFVQAEH